MGAYHYAEAGKMVELDSGHPCQANPILSFLRRQESSPAPVIGKRYTVSLPRKACSRKNVGQEPIPGKIP